MKLSFKGWYYKQQANGKTLAIIPGRSSEGAFIQIITDKASYNIPFLLSKYRETAETCQIGNNIFSNYGISLRINHKDISLTGSLSYLNLTPLKSDIMGPFRFFPMECRHGVISMRHEVSGEMILNGEKMNFEHGLGYIEMDSGRSFPSDYTWIQSNDFKTNCSIMAAVARIPFGLRFWGCICIISLNGKEYRLATYKGARIIRCGHNIIEIKQGKYHLHAVANQTVTHQLAAPKSGGMSRLIKESPSCPAKFVFRENGKVIFMGESMMASYEYVM